MKQRPANPVIHLCICANQKYRKLKSRRITNIRSKQGHDLLPDLTYSLIDISDTFAGNSSEAKSDLSQTMLPHVFCTPGSVIFLAMVGKCWPTEGRDFICNYVIKSGSSLNKAR